MKVDLTNKVAIVTGGNGGIGLEIASKLIENGACVAVLDRNVDQAELLFNGNKGKGLALTVDITKKQGLQEAVQRIVENFGKIDILVNNAGIFRDSRLSLMSEEDWDAVMDVNLKGSFLCIQAVSGYMSKNEYGKIINLSSISYRGNFGQANYSASKAGIVSLTRTAAIELAPYVNVNCIVPGTVDTPLFQSMNEKGKNKLLRKVPLGRVADPVDIANAVLFLSSDASSYMTGAVLDVDGGLTAGINLR